MENKKFLKISLIYLIVMGLIASVFLLSSYGLEIHDSWYSLLIQVVILAVLTFGLYTAFVSKKPKQTFKDFGFKPVSSKIVGISILLGVLLFMLNSVVSNIFNGIIYYLGYETLSVAPLATTKYNGSWLITEIFFTACLPAVCEEFAHRGLLFNASKKTIGTRHALFISSLLFGLIHFNVQQVFYATILGYLIGLSSYYTDSIYPSIILHFINNFLSIVFTYIEANYGIGLDFVSLIQGVGITDGALSIMLLSLALMALIGGIIWCFRTLHKQHYVDKVQKYLHILSTQGVKEIDEREVTLQLEKMELDRAQEFSTNQKFRAVPEKYKTAYRICVLFGSIITIFTFIWGIL